MTTATPQKYLRNVWYVAGFADEINDEHPVLSRRLLDEPIVFLRDAAGALHALQDRCPHRFAPLSQGVVRDGVIECPYHGLRFGMDGRCVSNPHGDGTVPKAAKVPAYRTLERHGLIWWWPGDPALADESLIPDVGFAANSPEHSAFRGYLPTACDYQLVVDNILDLTHADYRHAGGLGSGAITRVQPEVEDLGERSVAIRWLSSGDFAPGVFDAYLRQQGQRTDQWTEVVWTAPAVMALRVGATLQGEPREEGFEAMALHTATPESEGRCHYWYWATRNRAIDPQTNEALDRFSRMTFEGQDKPMLEAQQQRIGNVDFWSLKPVLLPGDAGAVRARRKIDQLTLKDAPSAA
jgi:vanillate O-demethylase monooxygenase subunit